MSKKSQITKSVLCSLLRWVVFLVSSRLLVSKVKYLHSKQQVPRAAAQMPNVGATAVYAPSCL
jgi:hypothetical protein